MGSRASVQVSCCRIYRNERHSGSGESSGGEETLSENVRSIAAMLTFRFVIDLEGSSGFFVQEHVEDPLLIMLERLGRLSTTGKLGQEVPAICKALLIHTLDEVKGEVSGDWRLPIVGLPFVRFHDDRIILHPEESCMLAVCPPTIIDWIRKGYVPREFTPGIVPGMGHH